MEKNIHAWYVMHIKSGDYAATVSQHFIIESIAVELFFNFRYLFSEEN